MKDLDNWLTRLALASAAAGHRVTALAQDAEAVAFPESFGLSTNLLEVTLNLLMVLAAIVILAWIFKRTQGMGQTAVGSLRVTATLPLGPKERILLVQIGDEQIVVGASGGNLRTLHVLEQPLSAASEPGDGDGSFRERLQRTLRRSRS